MPGLVALTPVAGSPRFLPGETYDVDQDTYDAWCDGIRGAPAGYDAWSEAEVKAWVDGHPGRVRWALATEGDADKPRKGLTAHLEELAALAAWLEAEAAHAAAS